MDASNNASSQDFDLQSFFPYLVRVFYSDVTAALAEIYTRDHGLTPSEWRTMAILGATGRMPAAEIVDRSSMDKVSVSRSVKKMHARGLLEKADNLEDGRSTLLFLSHAGRQVYEDIVPKVLAAEARMLKGIDDRDFEVFLSVMRAVRQNLTR
ncbi:MAG: MarR family transcriptional regulator [Roseibium sp.]|nr:MarR family transcriptional regulator [Roseibium sp.]